PVANDSSSHSSAPRCAALSFMRPEEPHRRRIVVAAEQRPARASQCRNLIRFVLLSVEKKKEGDDGRRPSLDHRTNGGCRPWPSNQSEPSTYRRCARG